MDELLEQLLDNCLPYTAEGKVATYIPELAKGDPRHLGICICRSDGTRYQAGDCRTRFTIQSVVKPILLLLALMDNGEEFVRSRIGVEATGKPFDAINVTDQSLMSRHLNPMVNMGVGKAHRQQKPGAGLPAQVLRTAGGRCGGDSGLLFPCLLHLRQLP